MSRTVEHQGGGGGGHLFLQGAACLSAMPPEEPLTSCVTLGK